MRTRKEKSRQVHIEFVEIANFRKLLSTRIDFSTSTTLFVGANNSGKTSAIRALQKFLSPAGSAFQTTDITLCHWHALNEIGAIWFATGGDDVATLDVADWRRLLPALDLWLHVEPNEIHYVRHLIPTLEWESGRLGVRLQLEPKDLPRLFKDFVEATKDAVATKNAADGDSSNTKSPLTVWPSDLLDFMSRRMSHFAVRSYVLDPEKIVQPDESKAAPQALPPDVVPIDVDPLRGLIRVDDIDAQRGFRDAQPGASDGAGTRSGASPLSDQLRDYYGKHLDPTLRPEPRDVDALVAIQAAEEAFNHRLTASFTAAFAEVQALGYPGVTDPRPQVSTKLRATDGLSHTAAVSYQVDVTGHDGAATSHLRLPESSNGLGYQNLISIIFRLMSFRDAWLRVGKAGGNNDTPIEPLHLVLVEEPEAHLHAQVQQVFVQKAYDVLRNRPELGTRNTLRTQLVVSTHSSHVAHEIAFSCLRYFRRVPAGACANVPVSLVINMSEVFGSETETQRFVTRYLRAQHADLFFADAAILVEGPAERILLPNLIRLRRQFLSQCYITILEIGGSHAHRLRGLIEHLGLLTLIVTDIDTLDTAGKSSQPQRGAAQVTNNATLKSWVPAYLPADQLFDASASEKVKTYGPLFEVRVAYQCPIEVVRPGATAAETAYPYTFEDALALHNLQFFSGFDGVGLAKKFAAAINAGGSVADIGSRIFKALDGGKKAELALDVLTAVAFRDINIPTYIDEGLTWLEAQLKKRQSETLLVVEEPS